MATIQDTEAGLKKAARKAAVRHTLRKKPGESTKEAMNRFVYGILSKRFGIKKRHGHLHKPGKAL